MIDEETLVRRYMDSAPAPTEGDLEPARRALDEAIEHERTRPMHRLGRARSTLVGTRHRRPAGRLIGAAAAAVVVLVAVLVVVVGGRTPPRILPVPSIVPVGHSPQWRLAGETTQGIWAPQPRAGADSHRLACPTTSTCYALGPTAAPSVGSETNATVAIEVTHDGGATWTTVSRPAEVQVSGLTCPSATTCMALGRTPTTAAPSLLTTTNGGATWTSAPIGLGPGADVLALSCATRSDCLVAVGNLGPGGTGEQDVAVVTSDGGSHWTQVPLPGHFQVSTLQCVHGGLCIAGGDSPPAFDVTNPNTLQGTASVIYSTDGGFSWSAGVLPAPGTLVNPVSCTDAKHCMAVETHTSTPIGVVTTVNGGRTWTEVPSNLPAAAGVNAIACPNSRTCWMTGTSGPGNQVTGINFGQPSVFFSDVGGHSWSSEQLPRVDGAALRSVRGVVCPTTTSCFALGNVPLSNPTQPEGRDVVLSYSATRPAAGSS